jgi:hypothetical protein
MLIFVNNERRVGNVTFTPGKHDVDPSTAKPLIDSGSAIVLKETKVKEAKPSNKASQKNNKKSEPKTEEPKSEEPEADESESEASSEGEEKTVELSKRSIGVLKKLNLTVDEAKELTKEELMSFDGVGEDIANEILNA